MLDRRVLRIARRAHMLTLVCILHAVGCMAHVQANAAVNQAADAKQAGAPTALAEAEAAASAVLLGFLDVHPFRDGNGRCSSLAR